MTTEDPRTILVVGATGATGRRLVAELLERGYGVRVIVRSAHRLPGRIRDHEMLSIVETDLLDLSDDEMREQVDGCTAIASCLGHNMTLKGIYGSPRKLVTAATRRLCEAVEATRPSHPVRFVLMNTAGNSIRDEEVSFAERCVVGLIRLLLPPHRDNEEAADHLQNHIGQDHRFIEWVIVRPDSLIDEDEVTGYTVHPSPTRSAIFNAGKASRINVAYFMAELATDDTTWNKWKGRMPVIYNKVFS
ncbi:MAG: SDR family oxidoreductase [Euryarchaeota archaeon]|nr:SDR family oxidoreductase [Euryarchaeota archaeon]